jgi:drug/metabolite transporter (DMT)-like permease
VPVLLVLLNGTFASVSNIFGGLAGRVLPIGLVVWIGAPGAAAVAVTAALLERTPFSGGGFAIGVVAGLAASASLMAVYRAFAIGPVGLVAAIVACTGAVFISFAGFLTGERITPGRLAGLALCVVAVAMLTYRRDPAGRTSRAFRGPVLAVAAAAGFTLYLLILDNAPAEAGMWSLSGARTGIFLGASVVVVQWWLRSRDRDRGVTSPPFERDGRAVITAIAAGLLDGIGNVALILALRVGELFLFAILAPYSPLLTAVIGRVFLHERITRVQLGGVLLGAVAVVVAAT